MKLNYWHYGYCVTLEGTALELLENLITVLNEAPGRTLDGPGGYWELEK